MKIILEAKDYASICLNCPKPECKQDNNGQCERTRPFIKKDRSNYAKDKNIYPE